MGRARWAQLDLSASGGATLGGRLARHRSGSDLTRQEWNDGSARPNWTCALRLLSCLAFCLLAVGCSAPTDVQVRAPEIQSSRIEHQEMTRTFHFVMDNITASSASRSEARGLLPLVLAFHGSGGDGPWMAEASGLARLAAREGFAAVFPDGFAGTWADGRGTTPADRAGIDDVDFVKVLVRQLGEMLRVDPERVYAVGFSNGGMFVQRLLLEWPEGFRAGATVGATLPENLGDRPLRGPFRPLLLVHGTSDPIVPWAGGMVSSTNGGRVLSMPATVDFWAGRGGFSARGEAESLPDRFDDGTAVRRWRYGTGALQLYEIQNGGHGWPGVAAPPPASIFGHTCQEFAAEEAAWRFFQEQNR